MLNYINSLDLKKIHSVYRTEWTRYYVENNLYDENDDYKYISDNDVCIVVDNFGQGNTLYIGHKCIDYEDNEYVLYNDEYKLSDIKAIYSQLVVENKLNRLYFL